MLSVLRSWRGCRGRGVPKLSHVGTPDVLERSGVTTIEKRSAALGQEGLSAACQARQDQPVLQVFAIDWLEPKMHLLRNMLALDKNHAASCPGNHFALCSSSPTCHHPVVEPRSKLQKLRNTPDGKLDVKVNSFECAPVSFTVFHISLEAPCCAADIGPKPWPQAESWPKHAARLKNNT